MKTILIATCCLLAAITGVSLVYSSNTKSASAVLNRKLQNQVLEQKTEIASLSEAASNTDQVVSVLQDKLVEARSKLAASETSLSVLQSKVSAYQLAEFNRTNEEALYLAQVPKPTVMGDGKKLFPKVVSVRGGMLMENGVFVGVYGRKLLFRSPEFGGTAKTFDVDDLHPLVLKYASVDADAVKLDEKNATEAMRKRKEYQAGQFLLEQQASAIQYREQMKINADNAVAQAKIKAEQDKTETDRIKANAAMIEAQKPPTQIIMQSQQIQQTRIVNQQPQPINPNTGNVYWSN